MKGPILLWSALMIAGLRPLSVTAQMADPAIDHEDEPFCYFSQPTDLLGVMDGREGTLVTPEGYLFTGWGEMMFFAGNPPRPLAQRVQILHKGYLPVIGTPAKEAGIGYHFTLFAATLDGRAESPLINFIRVVISNPHPEERTVFSTAIRYQNEANTRAWAITASADRLQPSTWVAMSRPVRSFPKVGIRLCP